ELEQGNLWGIRFATMFHMTNDSHLFRTDDELISSGYLLRGNRFINENKQNLPLYEAKMIHHFNHRFGDYQDYPEDAQTSHLPDIPPERLQNPDYLVQSRYWVREQEVEAYIGSAPYMIGFRDITN